MERRGVVDHSHVECALSRQLVLWPTRSGLHVAARQLRHSRFDSRNSRFNGYQMLGFACCTVDRIENLLSSALSSPSSVLS